MRIALRLILCFELMEGWNLILDMAKIKNIDM